MGYDQKQMNFFIDRLKAVTTFPKTHNERKLKIKKIFSK